MSSSTSSATLAAANDPSENATACRAGAGLARYTAAWLVRTPTMTVQKTIEPTCTPPSIGHAPDDGTSHSCWCPVGTPLWQPAIADEAKRLRPQAMREVERGASKVRGSADTNAHAPGARRA